MADVYRQNDNVLQCYAHGLNYVGFERGYESVINPIPLMLFGNTIVPGAKIKALQSGNDRTSFELKDSPITYAGVYDNHVLFEFEEETKSQQQGRLFDEPKRPKWYLAFVYAGETAGLLMFSQPGACYDIRPHQIIYDQNNTDNHAKSNNEINTERNLGA